MAHLLCIFVTLIIGIVILALLWWVLNMAMGLLPAPINPKVVLAVKVLMALIVVVFIIYWLLNGMPCLMRIQG
jgi:hypothetical protein